jgi:hypothetical protein
MIILKKNNEFQHIQIRDEDGGQWDMNPQEIQWIEFFGDRVEIGTHHCILHADIIDHIESTLIVSIP